MINTNFIQWGTLNITHTINWFSEVAGGLMLTAQLNDALLCAHIQKQG